jgi:hypothetical protein
LLELFKRASKPTILAIDHANQNGHFRTALELPVERKKKHKQDSETDNDSSSHSCATPPCRCFKWHLHWHVLELP